MTFSETCFECRNFIHSEHMITYTHHCQERLTRGKFHGETYKENLLGELTRRSVQGEGYPMAARGPRRAPFGASRSARPLLPAEGVYSAGRDGRRDLKEDLDEGTHKRDGERCLREGLDEDSHKRSVGGR